MKFKWIYILTLFLGVSLYFNFYLSDEEVVLKFLTSKNHCPEGIDCFHDYYRALDYAKLVDKPVFIMFTGYACLSSRKHEDDIFRNETNSKLLEDDYVTVFLFVDDRTKLPEEKQIEVDYNGRRLKMRTTGDKWKYFQTKNFYQVSQPWFVLLSPNEQLLNKPIGYSSRIDFANGMTQFLKCGIEAHNSLK